MFAQYQKYDLLLKNASIFLDKPIVRVATHSGKSGKLREFLTCSKTQGDSGNFQIIENLRETEGSFKIKKFSGIFFLDLEWDLVNPVSIFVQKV